MLISPDHPRRITVRLIPSRHELRRSWQEAMGGPNRPLPAGSDPPSLAHPFLSCPMAWCRRDALHPDLPGIARGNLQRPSAPGAEDLCNDASPRFPRLGSIPSISGWACPVGVGNRGRRPARSCRSYTFNQACFDLGHSSRGRATSHWNRCLLFPPVFPPLRRWIAPFGHHEVE